MQKQAQSVTRPQKVSFVHTSSALLILHRPIAESLKHLRPLYTLSYTLFSPNSARTSSGVTTIQTPRLCSTLAKGFPCIEGEIESSASSALFKRKVGSWRGGWGSSAMAGHEQRLVSVDIARPIIGRSRDRLPDPVGLHRRRVAWCRC
jgi:hypothetical protein